MSVGPRRQCFSSQAHDKCAPTANEQNGGTTNAPCSGRIHAQEKGRPGDVPGRPVVRRCGQTTGPPESPARNEDTLRYATGSTTRGCSQGSTGRRRSCWTGSRTALLLSVMSGGPRTGMSSTEEDRTRLSRSTQPHFPNSSGNSLTEVPHAGRRPTSRRPSCPQSSSYVLRARWDLLLPRAALRTGRRPPPPPSGSAGVSRRRSAALGTLFLSAHRSSAFRTSDRGCRRHPVGFRTFRTHLPTPTNHAAGPTTGDPPP